MSKKITMLQIEPDKLNLENMPERMNVIAECPTCKGEGLFKRSMHYHGSYGNEIVVVGCERCGATGRLKADITIHWTPNNEIDDTNKH